jgi:HdeA/HdeB family
LSPAEPGPPCHLTLKLCTLVRKGNRHGIALSPADRRRDDYAQFVEANSESKTTITAWLAGYYTDVTDTEVIDLNGLKDTGSRLSAFCEANPNFDMSSAAEGMLGK